jgi:hypothetical protein
MQATSYVSDNVIMSQISSMHTDVTNTLASVACAFQIQAQESKAYREAQQQFQQDLLIRSDRREECMSAQMKAIQESNQNLVRLLVENRPSQNNATMGHNNQQINNNPDNSEAPTFIRQTQTRRLPTPGSDSDNQDILQTTKQNTRIRPSAHSQETTRDHSALVQALKDALSIDLQFTRDIREYFKLRDAL